MDTPQDQRWDMGQAVVEFSSGFMKGVQDFLGWISSPFDNCGLGHGQESVGNAQQTETGSVDGRLVVHGTLSTDKYESSRLTEEALGTLSPAGTLACHRSSSGFSSGSHTRDPSNPSSPSGSLSFEDGGSDDGVIVNGAKSRVTFDHDVDVRVEWHDHLAGVGHEGDGGRDRAATMVDEDDWWSLIESNSAAPTTDAQSPRAQSPRARSPRVQPPRRPTRAARFAMMDDDDYNDNGDNKDGRKPIAYGRMKDIVSSRRGGINDESSGEGEDDDDDDDEDEGGTSLLGSYDGSLASIKRVIFPPSLRGFRRSNQPAKRLFDSAALASSSPTRWMTPAELDAILSRIKGWEGGTGGANNRRRGGRGSGRKKSCVDDGKLGWGTSIRDERCRVSADHAAFKDELFGLAIEEHRSSLLFKRAFLNWERNSSSV